MSPKGPLLVFACAVGVMCAHAGWAANGPVRPLLSLDGLATFETAAGAPQAETRPTAGPSGDLSSGPKKSYPPALMRRIQEGLSAQGFYLGPIDEQFGPKTEAAIRAYQKSADLPADGLPSESLAIDLETGGKVGKLLNRLEKSRAATTEAAREALLSRPETRNLVEAPQSATPEKHDAKACLAQPEPRCLLIEASLSARDIDKPEMRDWALGEILAAQAKAGLAGDALATTRRIHDPRLIMVALRDIAKAQAESGSLEDALIAVDIIPDATLQVDAYISIAEILVAQDRKQEAVDTAKHLYDYLRRVESPLTKVTYRTRLAAILHQAGHVDEAAKNIRAAEDVLSTIPESKDRDEALRYIAAAYAETGQAAKSMEVLKQVKNGSDDVPVLIAAATGLAQSGSAEEALLAAESIEAVRYRALVLARIASYQAGAGDLESARTTLDKALEAAKQIRFPFAKAYAYSRLALALNDVGISAGNDAALLTEALDAAQLIKDDRLKAHILWTIADERRRASDAPGASSAQGAADTATADIMSPFSRVWMLCDIAEERALRKEMDAAWAVFSDALEEAKTITNAWGRARALGKVAATMTVLADHTTETPSQP